MKWKTHIRITNEVMGQLGIRLTDEEYSRLKQGVIAPDKWGDYPHHYGKFNEITNYLSLARSQYLQNDLNSAYYNLGVALHYIQDSYTTYPSFLPKHDEWEEWIEGSYYTHDIQEAIRSSVKPLNTADRCSWLAHELSRDVYGRIETCKVATINSMKKDVNTIASPKVDLNLGLLASYVVTKSILGPKTNSSLDATLMSNFNHFEGQLRMAELRASSDIIRLVNKRNEQAKKLVPSTGIIATIKNWLTNSRIKSIDTVAISSKQGYFHKKHLEAVVTQYQNEVNRITADHVGWYGYHAPQIDTNIVVNELIEFQSASHALGLDQQRLKAILIEHNVPIYGIGGSELVERTGVDGLLKQGQINGLVKLPA